MLKCRLTGIKPGFKTAVYILAGLGGTGGCEKINTSKKSMWLKVKHTGTFTGSHSVTIMFSFSLFFLLWPAVSNFYKVLLPKFFLNISVHSIQHVHSCSARFDVLFLSKCWNVIRFFVHMYENTILQLQVFFYTLHFYSTLVKKAW